MTSEIVFRIRAILFWQKVVLFHIKYKMRERIVFFEAVLFSLNSNYFSVYFHDALLHITRYDKLQFAPELNIF